ncbi:putative fatty acyl-CoA reductase CG5065 [Onthophagus taurus]|uniref:putative fatty acyl-CoA reductase CG5065 n=1 Tax=Onthophagus taurus TaxID=166361 RepID=UPI0039BE731D
MGLKLSDFNERINIDVGVGWQLPAELTLFDLLKSKSPKSLDKLRFISGDLKKANLGINEDELIVLLKDVDVVFHMAANVKFQEPLKETVLTNLGGSYNVLELAKRFKNLSVYIHVSTSYCHVNEEILEEKMYPAPHNPRKMLDLVQWMNENTLNKITPDIINGYPNTYAYTKSLTEELVGEYSSFMKIAILRPSIVTASLSEPFPGWVDNLNGPTGLMIGCGKGIIRSMLCNAQSVADLVPVDITINRMIVIAKELSNIELLKEPLIINLTGDADNSITWGETLEFSKKHVLNNPFSIMLWYPNATLRTCRFCHVLVVYLFHLVPAYFIDFLLRIIRITPFLVRTQRKVSKGLNILNYYSSKKWNFEHNKIKMIASKLSKNDGEIFNCDLISINWNDYFSNYILGIRKYVMHESSTSIPKAKRLLFRLYVLDLSTKICFLCFFIWIISYFISTILKC